MRKIGTEEGEREREEGRGREKERKRYREKNIYKKRTVKDKVRERGGENDIDR